MIGHYERGGAIKIGGTELDSPSEREIARQERMKRGRLAVLLFPRDLLPAEWRPQSFFSDAYSRRLVRGSVATMQLLRRPPSG